MAEKKVAKKAVERSKPVPYETDSAWEPDQDVEVGCCDVNLM